MTPKTCSASSPSRNSGVRGAVQQRDAADEGRLDAYGSIIVGTVIVNKGKVVRPSQLIARVGLTFVR